MSWNDITTEIVSINGAYVSTSTSVVYIPLVGSIIENASPTSSDVVMIGNGKLTRLLSINFMTDSAMGSTAFTLVEDGTTIATKTVNISAVDTLYRIDFTIDLDNESDTNQFTDLISIGVNPATSGSSNLFSTVFERSLL